MNLRLDFVASDAKLSGELTVDRRGRATFEGDDGTRDEVDLGSGSAARVAAVPNAGRDRTLMGRFQAEGIDEAVRTLRRRFPWATAFLIRPVLGNEAREPLDSAPVRSAEEIRRRLTSHPTAPWVLWPSDREPPESTARICVFPDGSAQVLPPVRRRETTS